MTDTELITQIKEYIANASKIAIFTGAGISTDSGIPDYRGPYGVWTQNPNLAYVKDDSVIDDLRETVKNAEPNNGHLAVNKLWEQGKLLGVITQNVDRLHQAAGLPDNRVYELHGSGDNIVRFGDLLDKRVWLNAERTAMGCDLMIVLGSSLQVYPAAGLVEIPQRKGVPTIIINNQTTDYDKDASLVIHGGISDYFVPAIL